MTPDDATAAFAELHTFSAVDLLLEERDAIRCVVDCHNDINEGYANLPSAVLERDMAVGLIWQLYERCTEQIHGALVAITTSCAAASEVVARASLEATVTLRYILGDRNRRLASFLQNHLDQTERQEKQWRKAAEQLRGHEKSIHLAACDYRRQGNAATKTFVAMINSKLVPSAGIPAWPNIASRFETIGQGIAYRTFYARLCAEPHFDAEATLHYFIGQVTSPEVFEKMAVETVMFSRFMLAEAVRAYAVTGKEYAIAYDMPAAIETCKAAEHLMYLHSLNLSRHVGGYPSELSLSSHNQQEGKF